MNKLLFANINRLKKEKSFWITTGIMFLLGIYICYTEFQNSTRYKDNITLDSFFFGTIAMIGVIIGAFSSMYIGTEYSDGTIRNKIVIGHTRKNIYFSNFIICSVVGVISYLFYAVVVCLIGIPMFGFFQNSISLILMMFLDSLLLITLYGAIFNLIAMLITNKAHAAIISMLGIIVAIIVAVIVLGRLQEPEMLTNMTYMIDAQQMSDMMPNPRYLTGVKRNVFQTILDILPTGQGLQISGVIAPNPGLMAIYSVILIILTNIIGVFSFSRKDLK